MHPVQQGTGRFARIAQAQVAELVDALVSNTNAFGRAGSTPALGTERLTEMWVFFYGYKKNPILAK